MYRKTNQLVKLSELIVWHEIKNCLNSGKILSKKLLGLLNVIQTLYLQPKEMYDKYTIKERIVSL